MSFINQNTLTSYKTEGFSNKIINCIRNFFINNYNEKQNFRFVAFNEFYGSFIFLRTSKRL